MEYDKLAYEICNKSVTVEVTIDDLPIDPPDNRPPLIGGTEDRIADAGSVVSITVTSIDPDQDNLSYIWEEVTNTDTYFQFRGPTLGFVAPQEESVVIFKVTVSDGFNLVSEEVKISIVAEPSDDEYEWTDLTPRQGARVYYVAPDGNDSNDGDQNSPFASVGHAYNKLREDAGDQIRIRGDATYSCDVEIRKDDIVICKDGDGSRPKLVANGNAVFKILGERGGSSITFSGLDFRNVNKFEGNGIRATTDNFDNVLIEDCAFFHVEEPILIQGDTPDFVITNTKMRRCFLRENGDKAAIDGAGPDRKDHRSSAMYLSKMHGLIIEDSVIAYCGFSSYDPSVRSQYNPDLGYRANASIYSHGLYNQYSTKNDSIVRNCIFIECASHGLQWRAGGDVEGNVFYRCPIGMLFGNEWSNEKEMDEPINGNIQNNAFFDGVNLNHVENRGWGIEIQQGQDVTFDSNILVGDADSNNPMGVKFGSSKINDADLKITNNIVDWTNPFYLIGKVENLTFSNNQYFDKWRNDTDIGIEGIKIPRQAGKWQDRDTAPVIVNLNANNNQKLNNHLPTINDVIPDFEQKILNQFENGWDSQLTAQKIIETYRNAIN